MKERSAYEPLLFATLILVGAASGYFANNWFSGKVVGEQTKLEQIMSLVESHYVDPIDEKVLEETAIHKYLSSFDPHSLYIPPKFVDAVNQELKGGFEGIGIEFFVLNDTPYVVRVMEDGPAQKAGIRAGDRFLKADSISLLGLTNSDIIQQLKGPKNSEVHVLTFRKSSGVYEQKALQRAKITQESVRSTMISDHTAYFKILHFAEPTHTEFTDQYKALKKDHDFDELIIDLRDNPGGYLKTAIDLLDEFIDDRSLLTYTQGKSKNQQKFKAKPGGLCKSEKLICLVNENSASASEIFSGAIQDLDRGLVMGRRTFGKGLVQETFQLKDGSQIRLTVSRYYIPSGRSIQKPYDERGYTHKDSVKTKGNKIYRTRAGREVKAGGGVVPDVVLELIVDENISESIPIATARLLDELGKKDMVTVTPDVNAWFELREVKRGIEEKSDHLPTQLHIRRRLIYQLWGPQAVMEDNTLSDAWVSKALNSFPQIENLLNP